MVKTAAQKKAAKDAKTSFGNQRVQKCEKHWWSDWKEIGRTGDWFHPLIVERTCSICGVTEIDEH